MIFKRFILSAPNQLYYNPMTRTTIEEVKEAMIVIRNAVQMIELNCDTAILESALRLYLNTKRNGVSKTITLLYSLFFALYTIYDYKSISTLIDENFLNRIFSGGEFTCFSEHSIDLFYNVREMYVNETIKSINYIFNNSKSSLFQVMIHFLQINYNLFQINQENQDRIQNFFINDLSVAISIFNEKYIRFYFDDVKNLVLALFDTILEEYSFYFSIPGIGQWYQFFRKFTIFRYININAIQKIKKDIKFAFTHRIDDEHNQITVLIHDSFQKEKFTDAHVEEVLPYKTEINFSELEPSKFLPHPKSKSQNKNETIIDHMKRKNSGAELFNDYVNRESTEDETDDEEKVIIITGDNSEEEMLEIEIEEEEEDENQGEEEDFLISEKSMEEEIQKSKIQPPKLKKNLYNKTEETERSVLKRKTRLSSRYEAYSLTESLLGEVAEHSDSESGTAERQIFEKRLNFIKNKTLPIFHAEGLEKELLKKATNAETVTIIVDPSDFEEDLEPLDNTLALEISDELEEDEEEEDRIDDESERLRLKAELMSKTYETMEEAFYKCCEFYKDSNARFTRSYEDQTNKNKVFNCQTIGCSGQIVIHAIIRRNTAPKFQINSLIDHSCTENGKKISNEELDSYIKEIGEDAAFSNNFMKQIMNHFNLDINVQYTTNEKGERVRVENIKLPRCRIYRRRNAVYNLTPKARQAKWSKLVSFAEENARLGGKSKVLTNDKVVEYVSILPRYARNFILSDSFFPVLLADGTFLNGIGKGVLLIIVTLTGNRNVLPISWGWGESEDYKNCKFLYDSLKEFEDKIETMLEDGGTGLNSSLNDSMPTVNLQLCCWHISKNLSPKVRGMFWRLVKSKSYALYIFRKERIQTDPKYSSLNNALSDKWHLISKWETNTPRNGMSSSGAVESFNNLIANLRMKEPYDIFKFIYCYGISIIDQTLSFSSTLMPKAEAYILKAMQIAANLEKPTRFKDIVTFKSKSHGNYQVDLRCMVCTCKIRSDTGLPCVHLIRSSIEFQTYKWTNFIHSSYFTQPFKTAFPEPIEYPNFVDLRDNLGFHPRNEYSLKGKTRRHMNPEEKRVKRREAQKRYYDKKKQAK